MHKLAIFLIGLLVILLPVGNSLNISTANAIADFDKDNTHVNVNKIKCINTNLNINGVNSGDINAGNKNGQGATANSFGNGNGYYNDDKKTFDCSVSNKNNNTNIISTGGGANNGNQIVPPEPEPEPEPTTATLTVNKEIFGCTTTSTGNDMFCQELQDGSASWLPCIGSSITGTTFCQNLPPNLFDIEVFDDQNTQLQQFEGSTAGTTIQNLQPGTYTVNEIKHTDAVNQLGVSDINQGFCIDAGFTDGGRLDNQNAGTLYPSICFKYEDEQGNDCNTVTLSAGEDKTCTVKNYIRQGGLPA